MNLSLWTWRICDAKVYWHGISNSFVQASSRICMSWELVESFGNTWPVKYPVILVTVGFGYFGGPSTGGICQIWDAWTFMSQVHMNPAWTKVHMSQIDESDLSKFMILGPNGSWTVHGQPYLFQIFASTWNTFTVHIPEPRGKCTAFKFVTYMSSVRIWSGDG